VQVVDCEHHRLGPRYARQEGRDRVEQAEAGRLRVVEFLRGPEVRKQFSDVGDDIRDLRRACTQLRTKPVRIGLVDVGTDRLHPRPVGRRASRLPAAAPEHLPSAIARPARQLLGKTTLTDARLSADGHEPPTACQRVVERAQQGRKLSFAPHEDAAPCVRWGQLVDVGRLRRHRRRRPEVQRRVLPENRLLEVAEPPTWLEPELLDHEPARLLVGLQGFGLAVAAIEGEHQLRAQALAQRVAPDQRFQLADELGLAAERQIGLDSFLERHQAKLLEPRDLFLGKCLVGEVGQRRAAPKAKRLTEDLGGSVCSARGERPSCLLELGSKALGVELPRVEPKDVAGWTGQERTSGGGVIGGPVGERSAQVRDVALEQLGGALRRSITPEAFYQAVGRDDLVPVYEQQGEQGARFPGDRERTSTPRDLQWPEHAKLDRSTLQARRRT
jgi:hypothetical protein